MPPRLALETGLHLISERKPKLSYALLAKRQEEGSVALVITREHPEKVAKDRGLGPADCYWLSSKRTPVSLNPRGLRKIQRLIDDFLKKRPEGTVLLAGVEHLFDQNGYAKTLGFLDRLEAILATRGGVAILPVDFRVFGVAKAMEMRDRFAVVDAAGRNRRP